MTPTSSMGISPSMVSADFLNEIYDSKMEGEERESDQCLAGVVDG